MLGLAESEQAQPRRKPIAASLGLLPIGLFVAAGLAAEEVTELREVVVTAPAAGPTASRCADPELRRRSQPSVPAPAIPPAC